MLITISIKEEYLFIKYGQNFFSSTIVGQCMNFTWPITMQSTFLPFSQSLVLLITKLIGSFSSNFFYAVSNIESVVITWLAYVYGDFFIEISY